jgi:hypothetical protein
MCLQRLFELIFGKHPQDEQCEQFEKHGYKRVSYDKQNDWIKSKIAHLNEKGKAGSYYNFTGKKYKYVICYDKRKKCTIYKKEKPKPEGLKPPKFKPVKRRINYLKANKHRVLLINNEYARNPTYSELVKFLDYDKTETIKYIPHKFVCADFAQVLHNRAEKYGIKAGWVSVDFTFGEGHACNAFKTVDRGLIFVDCTNSYPDKGKSHDKTVHVRVGADYIPKPIHPDNWQYYRMGVVKRYKVYW